MFNTDKPIERSEFDRLNRTGFARELASAILSYTEKDNFTMSLCGKWGSGKTSIINMVVEEIEKKTKDDKEKPIIVRFDPWNYSKQSQLITQFFESISRELKLKNNGSAMEEIGNAIASYSDLFSYLTFIPVTGKFLLPVSGIVKGIGSELSLKGKQKNSLINQKSIITQKLFKQNRKIIVIIDDIDRLNNDQIRLIFQLVNSVAGFPNIIYILSFDKEIVARALSKEQNCNGEEYLEKIIQVPFDIPASDKNDINNIFFERLNQIIAEVPGANFDQDYWYSVFSRSISPFINTIRDVNRVINVFKFKYGYLYNEVNFCDLLAITTFQVCASPIYNWIQDNIKNLAGSSYGQGISTNEQNKNIDQKIEELKNIYDNPKLMLSALQPLFPRLSWNTGGYTTSSFTKNDLKRAKRIADPERSDLYFQLSIEKIKVTNQLLFDSIKDYTSEQLDDLFIELFKTESIKTYLIELDANIQEIPSSRYNLFVPKLLELTTYNYQKKNMFDISPDVYCYQCCWSIFSIVGEVESYNMIRNYSTTLDNESFEALVYMIVLIEKAYGRIGSDINHNHQIISEEHLSEIEEIVIKRVLEETKNKSILRFKNFWGFYHLWKYKDDTSLEEHIKQSVQDVNNTPYFLSFVAETWRGEKTQGWTFNKELITTYLSIDELYNNVISIKESKDFSILEIKYQELIAAFFLWYHSSRTEKDEISREDISNLLAEWDKKGEKR